MLGGGATFYALQGGLEGGRSTIKKKPIKIEMKLAPEYFVKKLPTQ